MIISKGTRLGPFEVLSQIGAGGMGQVYRARDTRLGRDVALKVLPPALFDEEEWVARFEREAKIVSTLNHPHILTIHEIAEGQIPDVNGTVHYIVTEFIDGWTLREAMVLERDRGVLFERLAQAADALQKAHGAGVVHRDLKPENIMFTRDGYAKVLDFGLAKMYLSRTKTGSFQTQQGIAVGTIGYMSPEQMQGKDVDHRSDIFSFGVILYELLAGHLPFQGETLMQTLHAIVIEKPAPLPAGIDPQVRELVRRCLEKEREARIQTMHEIATLLRDAAARSRGGSGKAARTSARSQTASPSSRLRTLAIMPFTNVSGDPEMEYLSDGITETIIYTLSQVRKRLRVVARNTVFAYKERPYTPQQLATELGATAVVTGRVQRVGNNLVVVADLMNTSDGTQAWGQRFHRPFTDIFELQDEVANSISEQLKLKLSVGDRQRLVRQRKPTGEAYELFLKARFHFNRRTAEGLQRALSLFEEAVALDPKYAQAWSGLAEVHTVLRSRALTRADDSCARGEAAARRALELDPALAEPHATLGGLAFSHRWLWDDADQHFREAVRLDPQCVPALQWHSGLLAWLGMLDEARSQARLAAEYEPLSLAANLNYGAVLYVSGRLEEAAAVCRKVLDLEPRFHFAYWMQGRILLARGLASDAVKVLRDAADECGRHSELLGTLGYAFARSGMTNDARAIVRELEAAATPARNAMALGEVWLGLGDLETSMQYIEHLFIRRGDVGIVLTAPEFAPLRSHSAFETMLARVGFPERRLGPDVVAKRTVVDKSHTAVESR